MHYLKQIGSYFLMVVEMFRKPTKWSVMRRLILKDIDDLIIGSIGIVSFIAFFVGGVITIQTALNIDNPLIPKSLVGFATRQSIILEFAPTFVSVIMAGKVGSFITSSIGTMRVTEQIDALEVMGINSVNYLQHQGTTQTKTYVQNTYSNITFHISLCGFKYSISR